MIKKIPKVPFIFLLRRIFNLKKHLLNEIEYLHTIYGNVFGIQVENLKCFIKDPNLIKQVLVQKHLNYEKGVGFKTFQNVIGFGLLTSDGNKWSTERKVLNKEFSNQSQDNNYEIIQNELNTLKKKWDKSDRINLTQSLNELTIKTICKILFNYNFEGSIKELRQWFHDYDHYIGKQQKSFIKLSLSLPIPYLMRAKAAIKGLRNFSLLLKQECLESTSPNMIKRMHEAGFDDKTICDHILTFFIAGHETTANSINFTFLLLRDNQKERELLQKEIDSNSVNNREQLYQLTHLDNIIKESLRLYPTIPLFPRIAKEDDTLGDYKIHRGDMIVFSPWIMHRSELFWEKPLDFIPQRFENNNFEKDFIYFPFGGGPRKCIGATMSTMQMKMIIHFIFKNYSFKIEGPYTNNFTHNVSLAPSGDIYLNL